MNDSSSLINCQKRLSQTRISSYFPGCVKMPPQITKSSRKIKKAGTRKSRSCSSSVESLEGQSLSEDVALSLIADIPKRKLPAPIFSDDEDSENEPVAKSPRKTSGNPTQIRPSTTPIKSVSTNSSPNKTPVSSPPTKTEPKSTPTSSKKVRVLQNIVVGSPKKEPLKTENKNVNYEQVKVMQEFFRNVNENDHLRSCLTATDIDCLSNFFKMDQKYQFVCIKLFLWKPLWYNIYKFVEKIALPMNDCEISTMYNFFKQNDYVKTDCVSDDLMKLLLNLNLTDLRDIARSFKFSSINGPKDGIISRLLKHCKLQATLSSVGTEFVLRKRIKEKMGFCVKLSDQLSKCLYHVYVLSTFSNSSLLDPQDYFTNVSYLKMVFPPYDVENYSIFMSPEEFSRFVEAVKLGSEFYKAVEKKNLTEIFNICTCAYDKLQKLNKEFGDSFDSSRLPHLERFTPNFKYAQILSNGAKHITTTYYENVIVWYEYLTSQGYCRYKRGEWYAHLTHIYTMYIKNYEKAAKLLIKVLKEEKDNLSDVQLQELAHRGKMLNRKTYKLPALYRDKIASLSPPLCDREWPQDVLDCNSIRNEDPGRRRMYVHHCDNGDVDYLTVEETALKHYRTLGFPHGRHCEGRLIIAAFSLLFWDIIYESNIQGTFVSNIQSVPLDMYTKHFYENREHRIKKRLDNIKEHWTDHVLEKVIENNWFLHSHESALCLMESVVEGPELLFNVITCIGRTVLAKIFERLVRNFKLYHSGFPDLVVWNVEERKAKFVEVKSENDKLSLKQKLWLNYLMDIDATVAVCHVESKSSKKKLKISKEV